MNKEEKITRAYSDYATTIQRMCYMYLGDYHLAEDAMSETFLKAYKSIDTFKGTSNIKTWLVRIAINTCKNMVKKESVSDIPTVDEELTLNVDASINPHDDSSREYVSAAIMSLPDDEREIVILYYYMEYRTYEIAKLLNIPRTTVNFKLRHAKERLKTILKGEFI